MHFVELVQSNKLNDLAVFNKWTDCSSTTGLNSQGVFLNFYV